MLPVLAFMYAGCIALCLAMPRHFQQLLPGRRLSMAGRWTLRGGGWLLLAASFFGCARECGYSVGAVTFCGLLSLVAPCLVLLLCYAPRLAIVLLCIMPLAYA